jgi:RNA polymerase sigma factor (sigma-70 family)
MLRAYLHKNFPKLSEVDDVVQESYLKLFRTKASGTLRSAKAFLFVTARHAALDRFRRNRAISLDDIVDNGKMNVIEDRPGVAETVSRNQELDLLADAIESLPGRCRQVLKLRKIYGLSHKEIAERLNISERTVNVQVGNGVRRCAEYLQALNMTIARPGGNGKSQSKWVDEK